MEHSGGPADPQTSVELAHYARVLRRRFWVVLLGAAAGLLLAVGYLALVDRTVTATTSLNINVISSDPFNPARAPADLVDAETEKQVATSSSVMRTAAASMEGTTPSEMQGAVKATLVPDATIMRISYSAPSTEEAEQGAEATAEAYLDFRSQQAKDRVASIVDQLTVRRDKLLEDLVRVNTIINDAEPSSQQARQAASDRQQITIELDALSTQINSYLGLDTTGGTVLSEARESPTVVSPSRILVLAIGVAGGTLLGVVLAFLLAAMDRRVRDDYDVRRMGGGELIGEMVGTGAAIPAEKPDMEALRAVRERLLATMPDNPPTVAVADLTTSGRIPDVAVNLADTFAEANWLVDLVLGDADEELIGLLTSSLGLTPVEDRGGVPRYTRSSDGMCLVVPPPGVMPPPQGTVRKEPAAKPLVTVIALPRGASESVLLTAGRMGHSIVLVVSRSGTRRSTVTKVSQELAVVGARIHGTIFKPRPRRLWSRRART